MSKYKHYQTNQKSKYCQKCSKNIENEEQYKIPFETKKDRKTGKIITFKELVICKECRKKY